jgi:glycosyltransferase involved in cell wall biosynthesis
VRVLFANTRYPPEGRAGPAFSVQYLAEQHAREGGSAIVFCRSDSPGISREVINGVEVLRAGIDLATEQLLGVWGQVLDHYRPDIVHTNLLLQMPPTLLARWVKQRGLKLVHTIREVSLICPQEGMRNGRICLTQCEACRVATAPHREFADLVDAAVGVSQFILDIHHRAGLFPASRTAGVVHNSYEPPQRLQAASPVGSPIRIGFLGRLDPTKGIELLLRTLSGPLAARSWTLAAAGRGSIAGRGPPEYEARLKRTYCDPRIQYVGFVTPHALLSQVDVAIVPSLLPEAFARVIIEAYAHGVAIIGSCRGGIPEGIAESVTGLLFDPDALEGPSSLAAVIESLLDAPDKLAAMKQQALVKWRQDFTPEKILAEYREVYDAVANV